MTIRQLGLPLPLTMETESVKSNRSEISSRSKRSRANHDGYSGPASSVQGGRSSSRHHHSHHGHKNRNHSYRSNRSDHSAVSPSSALHRKAAGELSTMVTIDTESGGGGEVIEVQILPQDDNWGDNTTAITGTSERSASVDDVSCWDAGDSSDDLGWAFRCQRYMGSAIAALPSIFAFVSPVAMVALPKLELMEWQPEQLACGPHCDGLLVSFSFKLLILAFGTWAVFLRQPKATMPRIFIFRAVILALVFVFSFSYWLFYGVRVLERRDESVNYESVVVFATSLVDALLFIHYLAVLLIEIRHLQPQYFIKVVRSPDGESRAYGLGQLSIQRAAVWVLERYYCDFPIYNPYLERIPTSSRARKAAAAGFKFYNVDCRTGGGNRSQAILATDTRRRDSSHNERFYEEHEYERRVRKRKTRLITAVEEAFTHIRRINDEQGPAIPMDPYEAAQAIFPSMARALQKFLRITRQQPRHTMESILQHLANCLAHDASPRAFLEKYIITTPILQSDREIQRPVQTWALICDILLSRPIEDGLLFQLHQQDVSLLCSVHRLPHFNVTEEIIDPKSNRFVLRLNSETSV